MANNQKDCQLFTRNLGFFCHHLLCLYSVRMENVCHNPNSWSFNPVHWAIHSTLKFTTTFLPILRRMRAWVKIRYTWSPQIGALCFRTTSSAGPTHLEFSHTRYLCQLKSVLTSWPKDPSSFLLLFPSPSASIPRFLLLKAPLYLGSFGQMSQDSTFFSRMSYPSKTECVLFNSHNF